MPQLLALHRSLMAGLHPRAGRLRIVDARPSDRVDIYVPAAAVPATLWSFFDVANARALRLFGGSGCASKLEEADDSWEEGAASALDEDGALRQDVCDELLAATPADPEVHDIDESALEAVIQHAAWFAAHFLEIHPFGDGNGRATRILVDALLAAVHPVPVPLVPVGASLETARQRWIAGLRELPPWAHSGGAGWAGEPPPRLCDLIVGSLVASWRRLEEAKRCFLASSE